MVFLTLILLLASVQDGHAAPSVMVLQPAAEPEDVEPDIIPAPDLTLPDGPLGVDVADFDLEYSCCSDCEDAECPQSDSEEPEPAEIDDPRFGPSPQPD